MKYLTTIILAAAFTLVLFTRKPPTRYVLLAPERITTTPTPRSF
jgi:hypothetical protein